MLFSNQDHMLLLWAKSFLIDSNTDTFFFSFLLCPSEVLQIGCEEPLILLEGYSFSEVSFYKVFLKSYFYCASCLVVPRLYSPSSTLGVGL